MPEEKTPAAPTGPPRGVWLAPMLLTRTASASSRRRRVPPAVWAGAVAAVFAAGVVGTWRLWEPEPQPAPAEEILSRSPAFTPVAAMPGPADTIPDAVTAPAIAGEVAAAPSSHAVTVPVSTPTAAPAPAAAPSPAPAPASPPAPQETETAARAAVRRVLPFGGPLARPGEAMVAFFGAATWQERLRCTLSPEKMKPLMESYYREGGDGPILPEEVELTRLEPTEDNPKLHYYSFIVYLPGRPAGIPLSVEDTKDGTRVEWRTFVECKDHLLERFYKDPDAKPATFRVFIRRSHYFEKDVPQQDRKQCFEISPPDATGSWHVWVDLDSPVYRTFFAAGERARWDVSSMMTLSLAWQKPDKGAPWVQIREVAAQSWHPGMLPAGQARP